MRKATIAATVITAILFTFLSTCTASTRRSTHTPPAMQATATSAVVPTPTPANTTSEEELASMILASATQIEDAFGTTINTMRTEISDSQTTEEISSEVLAMLQTIQSELSSFEQTIRGYTDRFNALSPETSSLLIERSDRFEIMRMMIDDLISDLETDSEIDPDAIDNLDEVWTEMDLASSIRTWKEQVLTQIDRRETYYMNVQSQSGQVAYNRVEAFIQAHDFIQASQNAFDDGIFTPEELGKVSQIAANAEASLFNTGDPQLFGYARAIDRLTRIIVRGDWPDAADAIEELRRTLPARPQP
jgi:hypothetical protein